MPKSVLRLLAVLFLAALPAAAGTLYVPLLAPSAPGDATWATRVWLTNHGDRAATVTTVRIRGVVDGTAHRDAPVQHRLAPGATKVVTTGPIPGLLEVRAPAHVAVSAELRNRDLPGTSEVYGGVPVIGSGNSATGGETVVLQGVRRTTHGVRTHLGVVNLGHQGTRCSIELVSPNGGRLGYADELPIPALAHAPLEDVLELVGIDQAGDVHARVSCNRRFYAYLAATEVATGETIFLTPSATGDSTLTPPAESSADEEPDAPSAGGQSVVFTRNGLVHSASRQKPTWTHNVRVPANTDFSKIVLEVDVTPGAWYAAEPHKMHNLFWIHRGGCCWPKYNANIVGYANAFGPGQGGNQVKVTHNLGRERRPFPKLKRGFQLRRGTTYRLRYVYDAAAGRISLKVFANGKLQFESTDRSTVRKVRSDGSGEFMVYFGHTPHKKGSGAGPERPTYGWKYANLRVEFFRA